MDLLDKLTPPESQHRTRSGLSSNDSVVGSQTTPRWVEALADPRYNIVKPLSALEVGDWVLYRWKNTERTGQLLQTGDPLVIVPPGGNEALAEEIDPDRVTAEWIPEQPYPHAGRGERGEPIGVN